MRRTTLAFALLLSACATAPRQPIAPVTPSPATPQPQGPRGIIGLTASELVGHFGNPALQIREGTSLKLQFRGRTCVLDAYLYPSGSGTGMLRVTHVDARAPSGIDYNQAACVTALESRN